MSKRAGGRRCCVPGCFSSTYKNPNVTFSPFPRDDALRREWVSIILTNTEAVANTASEKRPWSTPVRRILGSKHQSVCGRHFNPNGRKTYGDKMPKYFYHNDESSHKYDLVPERFINVSNYVEISPPNIETNVCSLVNLSLPGEIATGGQRSTITESTEDHNYSLNQDYGELRRKIIKQQGTIYTLESMFDKMASLTHENFVLKEQKTCSEKQIHQLIEESKTFKLLNMELLKANEDVEKLSTENRSLKLEIEKLKEQVKIKKTNFSLRNIKSSSMLQFYTGFQSMEDFNDLYEYLEPDLPNLNYYYNGGYERKTQRKDENNRGRPMSLDFKEQLFLVLCRLKVGLFEEDLAYRFEISVKTVSNLCITWFDFLDKRLSRLKIWPSRKMVNEDMPDAFKTMYPSTRCIIDCTELFIQTPNDYTTQSDTWSSYKSHNTAKGLIGICPNGFVSFVSKLSPGRMSDIEITAQSGIVQLLEPGDSVMADRGFTIGDLLKDKNVGLNIPPFLGKKKQLSLEEERRTRDIASIRIHVERVIRSVKKYHLLNTVFPNSMNAQLEKVWRICSYLHNFCNEPLVEVENSEL